MTCPVWARPRTWRSPRRVSLLRTWLIASALWLGAALYRIHVLHSGSSLQFVLHARTAWVAILGPPLLLAAVLLALHTALSHRSAIADGSRKA